MKRHLMPMHQRFHCLVLLIFVSLIPFNAQAKRIASLNYCYDQVLQNSSHEKESLLLLADHGGRAERIIAWQPDVVLVNAFTSTYLRKTLRSNGLKVVELPEPSSREQVREFRDRLFDATDIHLAHPGNDENGSGNHQTALVFMPNQWGWGKQSLFNDLLEDAGLTNLAAERGSGLVRISVEDVLHWQPDILILESYTDDFALAGLTQMHHSLKQSDFERLYMPMELSGCLGQRYSEALSWIQEQLL